MEQKNNWKGYDYDQLRFKRVMNATVLELEKARVMQQMSGSGRSEAFARPLVSKVLGSLNYVDYAVLAFRIGKRLIRLFRK